ncbi:arginyl-tRNA synthetase, partial [Aspergillus flavus]
LPLILQNGNNYGSDHRLGLREPNNPDAGRKRIIIEFGSPNIAKPFRAGHLRSTILGGFLANLVLGVGVEKFGDLDVLERDPIAQLLDVYVRVSAVGRKEQESIESMRKVIASRKSQGHPLEDMERELELLQANSMDERAIKYFKRMCEGGEEALGLWKKFRDLSIIKYQASFARLNIHYDVYAGESQIKNESMKEVENMTKEKRVSEVSDGAVLVDLTKYSKKLSKEIVRKKDGTSNYMSRDIGAVFERDEEYHYDNMIYVIASQQDLHMAQLIKIIELIGRKGLADKLEHVNFGLVHEMSTRRGTVKFLDDILRDAKDKMHEVMRSNQAKYEQVEDPEKVADILDISAVLVQDMASKRNDYTFDMDRMTSFEGDKGPYLQYSHARLCSIIRKADLPSERLKDADLSLLQEKQAASIVQKLAQWPEVFQTTFKNKNRLQCSHICGS